MRCHGSRSCRRSRATTTGCARGWRAPRVSISLAMWPPESMIALVERVALLGDAVGDARARVDDALVDGAGARGDGLGDLVARGDDRLVDLHAADGNRLGDFAADRSEALGKFGAALVEGLVNRGRGGIDGLAERRGARSR